MAICLTFMNQINCRLKQNQDHTLSLNVRFDVPKVAQMVPSFLGCFPFIHTLHVQVAFYFLPFSLIICFICII